MPNMNPTLWRLRDLLPFMSHDGSGGTRSAAGTLVGLSPDEAIVKLAKVIVPRISAQGDLQLRFKQLEEVRHEIDNLLPPLELTITESALPLPREVTDAALNADNLLKSIAHSYASCARGLLRSPQAKSQGAIFFRAIRGAMQMIARRQVLAYRAYALPSSASWQMLHELYTQAMNAALTAERNEIAPIEREYVAALLCAWFDPTKLQRVDLNAIHACAYQLAPFAVILDAIPAASSVDISCSFLINLEEGRSGMPLTRLVAEEYPIHVRVVDCLKALDVLDRNINAIDGESEPTPALGISKPLLRSMRNALAGSNARRHQRSRTRPHANVVGGLAQVVGFIEELAYSRRSVDAISRPESGGVKPSEWSIVDESPGGFRLRFDKGDKWQHGVGDLVAMQPRESSKVQIGLIRRISATGNRLEVGLQILGPQASAIEVDIPGRKRQHAIYLNSLNAHSDYAGIVLRPGASRAGGKIRLHMNGQSQERTLGKCIEANDGIELFALARQPN